MTAAYDDPWLAQGWLDAACKEVERKALGASTDDMRAALRRFLADLSLDAAVARANKRSRKGIGIDDMAGLDALEVLVQDLKWVRIEKGRAHFTESFDKTARARKWSVTGLLLGGRRFIPLAPLVRLSDILGIGLKRKRTR